MSRISKEELELLRGTYKQPKTVLELAIHNTAEELKRFRDLEEQGRLIELPCKVEDTIWAIFPTWTPMECEVVAIEILSSTVNIETKVVDSDADRIFWPADFGKTVFITKEEAERKLAELKGTEE